MRPRLRHDSPSPIVHDPDRATVVADILKAVAHPLRLRLIARLCAGDAHVGQLAHELGVSQAIVSQQLTILRLNRLVEAKREQGFATYRILEPRLRELVKCVERCGAE